MQIITFQEHVMNLDEHVNNWIKKQENIEIINILQSSFPAEIENRHPSAMVTITIIYKLKTK